jgi:hypothetical protein
VVDQERMATAWAEYKTAKASAGAREEAAAARLKEERELTGIYSVRAQRKAEEVPCLHTKPPRRLLGSVEPRHGTAGRGGDQCKSCGSGGAGRGGSCGAPGDRGSRCAQGRGGRSGGSGSGGGRSAQRTTTKCDRTVLRLVWLTRQ